MYEYKVVPAPVRTPRVKGLKTTGERFAHMLTEALNGPAGDGWEFLRTETLACEERRGLMGTATSNQVVLIFRRERRRFVPPPEPVAPQAEARTAAPPAERSPLPPFSPAIEQPDSPAPASRRDDPPQARVRRSEPVFRPGALIRPDGERALPPLRSDRGTDDT